MIAIIGAMDEEVAMLKEKMTEVQVESRACMEFYKGKLEGKDTVVVRSGIGKVNAAMCAQILATAMRLPASSIRELQVLWTPGSISVIL